MVDSSTRSSGPFLGAAFFCNQRKREPSGAWTYESVITGQSIPDPRVNGVVAKLALIFYGLPGEVARIRVIPRTPDGIESAGGVYEHTFTRYHIAHTEDIEVTFPKTISGNYWVDVFLNDRLASSVPFTIRWGVDIVA